MDPSGFILFVISIIISYAMMPKVQPPRPAAFEDFNFPQADEGTPQCVIFGDCWSEDWMVIAVGNYRTSEIRRSGGAKK